MPTVYVTAPPEDADDLAQSLVEERLAACVNLVDCHSTYWWDDEVVNEDESILLIKTTAERYDKLRGRIEKLHPHDVPCIKRFDETHVLDSYAEWISAEVE